jgi:hypothetical protein
MQLKSWALSKQEISKEPIYSVYLLDPWSPSMKNVNLIIPTPHVNSYKCVLRFTITIWVAPFSFLYSLCLSHFDHHLYFKYLIVTRIYIIYVHKHLLVWLKWFSNVRGYNLCDFILVKWIICVFVYVQC